MPSTCRGAKTRADMSPQHPCPPLVWCRDALFKAATCLRGRHAGVAGTMPHRETLTAWPSRPCESLQLQYAYFVGMNGHQATMLWLGPSIAIYEAGSFLLAHMLQYKILLGGGSL